jgi:hypothetical protein
MAGGRKHFFTTICQIHGVAPKGQHYKEVKVSRPTGKMLGRHCTPCPYCKSTLKDLTTP